MMNIIRKGQIAHVDIEKGLGIIVDENGQDIPFEFEAGATNIIVSTEVKFRIELNEKGLRALLVGIA